MMMSLSCIALYFQTSLHYPTYTLLPLLIAIIPCPLLRSTGQQLQSFVVSCCFSMSLVMHSLSISSVPMTQHLMFDKKAIFHPFQCLHLKHRNAIHLLPLHKDDAVQQGHDSPINLAPFQLMPKCPPPSSTFLVIRLLVITATVYVYRIV